MKVKKFIVRSRKSDQKGPCTPEIAALLTCWATSSIDSPSCAQTIQALTECMRKAVSIKFHLSC
jgi:hypothetical protein